MRRPFQLRLPALAALFCAAAQPLSAQSFQTSATSAYVYDITTDTVLLEKNADVALPPASMSKLMTLNMLFEALADGRITLDTRLNVSERAMSMGGSTMFLTTADRPTVDELIKGIIVNSGNDACVVVAEALGGTEPAFAQMMTTRAQQLGMNNSHFANASGWPDPQHRMSTHDLTILAERLITEFPQYYTYFAISEYPFDGRAPDNRFNRNPLLPLGLGADGLKTGHTQEAGYGLVGSAMQGGRRIVFTITGMDSEAERAGEGQAIINWAFLQFALKTAVTGGERVAEAPVWLGDADSVGLVPDADVQLLVSALSHDGLEAEITYDSPIEAPIAAGQELGRMTIHRPDLPDTEIPLYAEHAVGNAGFVDRYRVAALKLFDMVRGEDAAAAPAPAAE